jgi:hypothetical protein
MQTEKIGRGKWKTIEVFFGQSCYFTGRFPHSLVSCLHPSDHDIFPELVVSVCNSLVFLIWNQGKAFVPEDVRWSVKK